MVAAAISVDVVRTFLRIGGNALDGEIMLMIAAATRDLEASTGTRLIAQPVTVASTSFEDLVALPVGPVRAISAITYRGSGLVRETVPADQYELVGDGLAKGIAPIGRWPIGRDVQVELSVGYADTPADIPPNLQWALLALIRGKFEDRTVDIEPLIVNDRIWL